jgi:hypothetical protein
MEIEIIKNSILEIRGKKVILDFELAKLYEYRNAGIEASSAQKYRQVSRRFYVHPNPG